MTAIDYPFRKLVFLSFVAESFFFHELVVKTRCVTTSLTIMMEELMNILVPSDCGVSQALLRAFSLQDV